MKKNKKKRVFLKKSFFSKITIFVFFSFFTVIWVTFAMDVIWDYIKTQTWIGIWTNSNKITFSNKKTTYYINKNDDENFVWDQLRWYYYDDTYWYFRLDWDKDLSKNVYINSWPNNINWCNNAYSFTWSAYSKYVWYMDFHYDNEKFVYYCDDDKTIYWTWYTENLWEQIFDGIKINMRKKQVIDSIEQKIISEDDNKYIEDNNSIKWDNNWNNNNIWGWDKFDIENSDIDELDWNVFWIIK